MHWAIWYHDAVYDPQAKDNEEQSAQLAQSQLSALGLASSQLDHIADMIRATAKHMDTPAQGDMAFFLDIDLSILGVTPSRYAVYAQQVRFEYTSVPDQQFYQGRSQLLAYWLQMPMLYKTPYFQQRLEMQARNNLRAEWSALTKQLTESANSSL